MNLPTGVSGQISIMILLARVYQIEVGFSFMGADFKLYVSETKER
jgi:hypothetical protein